MKIKTTLTMLMAVIALAMMAIFQTSHSNSLTPKTTESFSTFSLPQNLGQTVNSLDNEQTSAVSPNGLSLYFSSDRAGGQGQGDIWVSQRATLTSAWGTPQNLGAIVNSGSGENSPAFSLDGRTMFFNSSRPGFGGQDIYITTRTDPNNDFGWTAPVNLGAVINTADAEAVGSYFEDPTTGIATLFFSSNRAGGLGDLDTYQSTRNANGTFNAPTIVTTLSSVSRDVRPFIRRDGLEVYLSSDRIGGLGRDIWVSTRASTSAQWNPPVNLTSLNSDSEDESPSLSPDGSVLYFFSPRSGGSGLTDLYAATRVSINRSATADFDGDGRTDLSVFRPSDGTWHILNSSTNTYRVQPFGLNTDKIVSGDYDGDGRTDFALFRPSTGVWYVLRSSDSLVSAINWGVSTDKPVQGDYDGDGRTDIAVYRDGIWYLLQSTNGVSIQQFGLADDKPVPSAFVP